MHPDTFEQVIIENSRLGRAVSFLAEAITVPVEFVDEHPIGIVFPEIVDVKAADTAVAAHGATNVWKRATPENGLEILVPPFIAPGETIRVDVERGTYTERARKK